MPKIKAITEYLKQSHSAEKDYHDRAVKDLEVENSKLQSKLDALLDLLLEKRITPEEYDKKSKELKLKQYDINTQLKQHIKADDSIKVAISTIFSLGSRAYELFKSSKIEQNAN